jgi:hypothetical protein
MLKQKKNQKNYFIKRTPKVLLSTPVSDQM